MSDTISTELNDLSVNVMKCNELSTIDKKYIIRLLKRDKPRACGRYRGTVNGEKKIFLKCMECGRNLRAVNETSRKEEYNRFCPCCGQRIKWS